MLNLSYLLLSSKDSRPLMDNRLSPTRWQAKSPGVRRNFFALDIFQLFKYSIE
jgi:hypothetical protein